MERNLPGDEFWRYDRSPVFAPRPRAAVWPYAATFESGQALVDFAVFTPDNYADGYAYPLIVWFHEAGGNEHDVLEQLPRISPQNYLGLGLRGPLPVVRGLPTQRTWSLGAEHLQWLEDQFVVSLIDTVRQRRVHGDRIIAAGIGRGGTVALQMMLRRPDMFAAAACLNADLPPDLPADGCTDYVGNHLWLGQSELLECGPKPAIDSVRDFRTVGFGVTPRVLTDDARPRETACREIDAWLMATLVGATAIF